jgi:hypothetical protein
MRGRIITNNQTQSPIWTRSCTIDRELERLRRDQGVRLDVKNAHHVVIARENSIRYGRCPMLEKLHVVRDGLLIRSEKTSNLVGILLIKTIKGVFAVEAPYGHNSKPGLHG